MRVTNNMITTMYTQGIGTSLSRLLAANEKVSAGRSLLNPEDDATNYLTAYSLQVMSNEATQYGRNAENALTWLENEDTLLQSAYDYLSTALNELAVQGMNDSQNAESRQAIAGDVLSIYEAMLDIGNSEYLGRYVFSGYETSTEPFTTGERNVSSVVSTKAGTDATYKKLYSDMTELKEGEYTVSVTVENGIAYTTLKNSLNKTVLIDSNGSDESATSGNLTSSTLVTKYTGEAVINTGVGVGIKVPDGLSNGESFDVSFYYTPGDDVTYQGDDGEITSKIASSQSVTINVDGQSTFMETNRTITGTTTNTMNGLKISESTKFSQIDGANATAADYISFTGTDHNGYAIGTARVSSPGNVDLDMTDASEEERTITLNYAGRDYEITMDAEGYDDMDDVVFNINRALDREGLGGEITAVADGNNVMFISSRTGSETEITVTGSDSNTLGFMETSVTGTGMDTSFSLSYDYYTGPVETTHEQAIDKTAAATSTYTFYVNEEKIEIDFDPGDTNQDIEDKLNEVLMDKGLGFTVYANVEDNALDPNYADVTFNLQNVELNDDTYLATSLTTGATSDYQFATARNSSYPAADEKTVGDMLEFVEDLYGGAVDAAIEDGKLVLQDLRSGDSNLTFSAAEQNTGIGYAETDKNIVLSGNYSSIKDDTWDFNLSLSGSTMTINVTNSQGNVVYNGTVNTDTYRGQDIYISNGVSITLGEITAGTSFSVDMTANSNLSFGDLNVTEKGENVNVFQSLKNLYDALNYNIAEGGIGAPSEWAENNDETTATPSLDGEFTANYNDIFTFSVESTGTSSEYYLQEDQTWESEPVTYHDGIAVSFDITINSDNLSPSVYTNSVVVNTGTATVYDDETLLAEMVQQINADATFKELGIKAYAEDGQLRIDTNSGNTEISVAYNNADSVYTMGSDVGSTQTSVTSPALDVETAATLDINYYDTTLPGWTTASVTVPTGTYSDYTALADEINNQLSLGGFATLFEAKADSSGKITINALASSGITDMIVSGDENGTIGFYNTAGADTVTGATSATMDLSEKDVAARTLTFSYNDGSNRTVSIVVDAENYQTYEDLVANINEQLTDAGVSGIISCEQVGYDGLGFSFTGVTQTAVAGDYNSTLGFSKGGDIVKMKVTGESGELINTYNIDSANEKYYVADGVYQYYDAGYLYATDSFTATVGSGIEYEMDVLAKAETQVLKSLTTVGNSTSKVESAVSFNENVVSTTTELKATYTQSTTVDQTAASAELTMAKTAYEAALQVTSMTMSISLLDYL